jgi:hypothetical protein
MLIVNNELESWLTGTAYLVANSFKPLSSESLIEWNSGPSSLLTRMTQATSTQTLILTSAMPTLLRRLQGRARVAEAMEL